jgi:hypothetical protein
MSKSYTFSPPSAFVACSGTALAFSVFCLIIMCEIVLGQAVPGTRNIAIPEMSRNTDLQYNASGYICT